MNNADLVGERPLLRITPRIGLGGGQRVVVAVQHAQRIGPAVEREKIVGIERQRALVALQRQLALAIDEIGLGLREVGQRQLPVQLERLLRRRRALLAPDLVLVVADVALAVHQRHAGDGGRVVRAVRQDRREAALGGVDLAGAVAQLQRLQPTLQFQRLGIRRGAGVQLRQRRRRDDRPPAAGPSNTVSPAAHASRCLGEDKLALADGAAAGEAAGAGSAPLTSAAAAANVAPSASADAGTEAGDSVCVVSAASAAIRSQTSAMVARRRSTLLAVIAWISCTHAGARSAEAGKGQASDEDWICAAASASPLKWANGRLPVSNS